jgi:hypothetical protein
VRRCCLLGMCRLSGLLVGLELLLRRGCQGLALGGLLILGRGLLLAGTFLFFEEVFSGATVAPCCANAAVFSGVAVSVLVMIWYSSLRSCSA